MADKNTPVLDRMDKASNTWLKIEQWATERLMKARIANDQKMDEDKRNRLGGRIEEIKELLNLVNDPPPPMDDPFEHLD